MSKKFDIKIKRGSFKKTQEKFLKDNNLLNENVGSMVTIGALNNPFPKRVNENEEVDYENEVEDAVSEFYSEFVDGGYLDDIGETVAVMGDDPAAPQAIKLLEKCANEMIKVINKYHTKINRL